MDLNAVDSIAACERGREITINDAAGNPTDFRIMLMGVDSRVFKLEFGKLNSKMAMLAKRGKAMPPDEEEKDLCRIMAKCTLGWSGLTSGGEAVPFSREKAEEIYLGYPLIHKQVFTELLDREAYLGNGERAG